MTVTKVSRALHKSFGDWQDRGGVPWLCGAGMDKFFHLEEFNRIELLGSVVNPNDVDAILCLPGVVRQKVKVFEYGNRTSADTAPRSGQYYHNGYYWRFSRAKEVWVADWSDCAQYGTCRMAGVSAWLKSFDSPYVWMCVMGWRV